MWPFSRKSSLEQGGFFCGYTDWHSHLLPGVDDGVQTLDETLEILRLYEGLSVSAVWLTPHIMEDMPNTPEDLKKRFSELQKAYTGTVQLHLAAENMLDSLFEERLEKRELLTLGAAGDHLLVETSYFSPPMNFHGLLERIKSAGYFPVLAHPERYLYMGEKDYKVLKSMGIRFQLNFMSPLGVYGEEARKKSLWLLANGCYDISGSDTHRLRILRTALSARGLRSSALNAMQQLKSCNLMTPVI